MDCDQAAIADGGAAQALQCRKPVRVQVGWLLSRRGRELPANASGLDTHRASISRRFDRVQVGWDSNDYQIDVGESKRPVIESPWSQFTSDCPRF
jgi:hypothetical protein